MAEGRGLSFRPVAGPSPADLVAALVEAGRNPLKYARAFRPLLRPHAEGGLADCLAACEGADAVFYTPLGFAGFMAAEHLGIPSVGGVVEPLFVRGGSYPSAVLGHPPRIPVAGDLYNRLSHRAVEQLYWRIAQPLVAGARRGAGLSAMPVLRSPIARIHRRQSPLLLGWSPHVLPPDARHEGRLHTTGYWFLDHRKSWQPPDGLIDFLEAGDPPVALGLGSMSGLQSADTGRIVSLTAEALGRTGMRGVLLSDQTGIDASLPGNVIRVGGELPYDWLFPRTTAVVHHGGAGTLAAALRAGVPSVVVPVLPDQAFWGARAAALGVAPPPIPPKKLTVEGMSATILRATTDPGLRHQCLTFSKKINLEDGVARAVGVFERYATSLA